jgi:hypothetical protein
MSDKDLVVFPLPKPIKYARDGSPNNETLELILRAPDYDHRRFARTLKQKLSMVMMSMRGHASSDSPESKDEVAEMPGGPETALMMMSAGDDVLNWSDFCEWFEENAKPFIFYDEVTPIGNATFEDIGKVDPDAVDNLIGAYIANFTMPSLMPKDSEESGTTA